MATAQNPPDEIPSTPTNDISSSTTSTNTMNKKKQLPRSERDIKSTPCPTRSPVKVFEIVKGQFNDTQVFARGNPTKSQEYEPIDNRRQASRKGFQKSLVRQMKKIKTTTNDDVFLAYRKSEKKKGDVSVFSTSKDFVFSDDDAQRPTTTTSTDFQVARDETHLNATFSPSRNCIGRAKPTARRSHRNCVRCNLEYLPSDDILNPWVGCHIYKISGRNTKINCESWAHASCTGFFPKGVDGVKEMPPWYCKKHRMVRIKEIADMTALQTPPAKKSKKSTSAAEKSKKSKKSKSPAEKSKKSKKSASTRGKKNK
jgi:hypothetical protein